MSDFIYSKVTFAGDSIEIMTPKHRPDAQHEHTLAYFEAFNELRRREADRVQEINSYVAGKLREPWKIHSRENPGGITTGSKYRGDQRLWHPTLPLQMWTAPKPLTDKQARAKALKIGSKSHQGDFIKFEEI
jgi:hypothetical protein